MACSSETPGCDGPVSRDYIEHCIRKAGWAGIGVSGDPGWNYTIGLTERGQPELVVFGLPPAIGHAVLANAITRLDDIRDGAMLDGIATAYPAAFREIPSEEANDRFLVQANHFYGRTVPVIQLVWPDRAGLFPWQRGCDARMASMQSQVVDFRAEAGPAPRRGRARRAGVH